MSKTKDSDQIRCDVCLLDDVNKSANRWCIECGEALCSDCCDAHRKVRQTRKHQIIDLNDASHQVLVHCRSNEECPKHQGSMLELFCLYHRDLCCVLCVPMLHPGCKSIRSLYDIAQRVEKYKEEASFVPEFEHMKNEMFVISKQQDLHADKVDKEYTDSLDNMDTLITEAKRRLDLLHGRFQTTLKDRWSNRKLVLSKFQKETQMLQINLENCVKVMSAITSYASSREVFVIQEQMKNQLISHLHEVKTSIRDYRETQLQLEIEDSVSKVVNSISSVGFISEVETSSVPIQNAWTRIEDNINILRGKPDVSLMEDSVSTSDMLGSLVITGPVVTLDQMTAMTRKVKSVTNAALGSKTRFTGGTVLPDGRLLLVDHTNKQIVMYDDRYNWLNNHILMKRPRDVAYSDKYRVVLVRTKRWIQKHTVTGDTLTLTSTIPSPPLSCSANLSGITVHDNTILVGTDLFVHILAMDGTEQKRIPRTGTCTYIAVSQDLEQFCYMDGKDIVCCNMEGEKMSRFEDQQRGYKRGITFDSSGNIYVCCSGPPPNVFQMSRDGQRGRDLVLDQSEIRDPLWVLYDHSKDMLLITSLSPCDNNNVLFEVFEFLDKTE
ncbi:uncharacterized protein LOC117332167 [Pecten maximus]|uniref:uncharacterized protein LOC117332167 n=1 Tax=Pecten maximus TaxID=6579 RepID=UPI00145885F6|nr:uncharacterized protein LOC117332167 [Pecten maximus]